MNTSTKSQFTVLSQLSALFAAIVGYAPSMREQLDGRLL